VPTANAKRLIRIPYTSLWINCGMVCRVPATHLEAASLPRIHVHREIGAEYIPYGAVQHLFQERSNRPFWLPAPQCGDGATIHTETLTGSTLST